MGLFDFDPNRQGYTYADVERRRALADALRDGIVASQPQTFGQGIGTVGQAIGSIIAGRKASQSDKLRQAEGDKRFAEALGGVQQPQAYGSGAMSYAAPSYEGSGSDLAAGLIETANAIGADPLDLATAVSYETAGTFDPTKAGPTTQWGQHRGLIQFGEPQAREYGVDWNDPVGSQVGADGAIANYFRKNGFKPGMSGLDLYSTINAGAPGRYSASDANNGGAPGSVADKWNNQMGAHRQKAAALLGASLDGSGGSQMMGFASSGPSYSPPPINTTLLRDMQDPYMTPEQKQLLAGIYQQQQAAQITPYQQAQLQMAQESHALDMAKAMAPEPVKGVEINGQLVNPNTSEVMGDYRTQQGNGGFRPASPEEAARYGAAGGQVGPDGRFYPINPPSGMSIETGPDGQMRIVQGAGAQGAAGKPFTEGQSKDIVFATRAEGALEAFEPYAGALTSRTERVAEGVPLGLGRGIQSPEFQMAQQSGGEFLQAILRKDTGAAITAGEQALYGQTYLPQPGDGPEVLTFKQAARQRAVAALKAGMSPAQILAQERALGQGAAAGQPPTPAAAPEAANPVLAVPADPAAMPPPDGMDPETWKFVSPEDRKLWQ